MQHAAFAYLGSGRVSRSYILYIIIYNYLTFGTLKEHNVCFLMGEVMFDKSYNVSVLDFGSELEVRLYDNSHRLPVEVSLVDDFVFDDLDDCPYLMYSAADVMPERVDLTEDELLERQADSERSSRARTMRQIYYLARSYNWEWFVTFTFSPDVVDRYDYKAVSSLMSGWLKALRRKCPDVRYMVVPELHRDGAYHFHGLLASCMPYLELLEHKGGIYNVNSFKYGYTTATAVKDSVSCSRYVSKYITKDLVAVTKGKKRYWHSRNVSVPDQQRLFFPVLDMNRLKFSLQEAALYKSECETPLGDTVRYYTVKRDALPPALLSELSF